MVPQDTAWKKAHPSFYFAAEIQGTALRTRRWGRPYLQCRTGCTVTCPIFMAWEAMGTDSEKSMPSGTLSESSIWAEWDWFGIQPSVDWNPEHAWAGNFLSGVTVRTKNLQMHWTALCNLLKAKIGSKPYLSFTWCREEGVRRRTKNNKQNDAKPGLGAMFEPPRDLLFLGTFEEARIEASTRSMWLVSLGPRKMPRWSQEVSLLVGLNPLHLCLTRQFQSTLHDTASILPSWWQLQIDCCLLVVS